MAYLPPYKPHYKLVGFVRLIDGSAIAPLLRCQPGDTQSVDPQRYGGATFAVRSRVGAFLVRRGETLR